MVPKIHCLTFVALQCLVASGSFAATPKGEAPASAAQANACKTEVVKFEETIGLIRQTQGNSAATALKEKLLPASTEAQLLATGGYCGLAKYMRDKKLNR